MQLVVLVLGEISPSRFFSSSSSSRALSGWIAISALEHVERDVDRLAVAEVLLAGRVLGERLAVDVLHDQVPLAVRRCCRPRSP